MASKGASRGGRARASVLTADERKDIARKAATARWGTKNESQQASDSLEQASSEAIEQASHSLEQRQKSPQHPIALFSGKLMVGTGEYWVYVLDNRKRVMAQRELVRALMTQNHGNLNRFLEAPNLQPFIPEKVASEQAITFSIPGTQFLGNGYEATLAYFFWLSQHFGHIESNSIGQECRHSSVCPQWMQTNSVTGLPDSAASSAILIKTSFASSAERHSNSGSKPSACARAICAT